PSSTRPCRAIAAICAAQGSTSVTVAPARAKAAPNTQPMAPAPIMTIRISLHPHAGAGGRTRRIDDHDIHLARSGRRPTQLAREGRRRERPPVDEPAQRPLTATRDETDRRVG